MLKESMMPVLPKQSENFETGNELEKSLQIKDIFNNTNWLENKPLFDENEIIRVIRNSSKEEFASFLLEDLRHNPLRHKLSKSTIEAILEKSFQFYESSGDDKKASFPFFIIEVNNSIQLHGDFKSKNPEEESITDKAFQSMLDLYNKYPEACSKFWNFLGQDGQTIRPDILIDGIAEIAWRPDFDKYFKAETLHTLNYLYAFFAEQYKEAIRKGLDFKA